MILVTGSHGFIGSRFVKHLNDIGITNIVVSDYLTNGKQFKNLDGCNYVEYVHPDSIGDVGWYSQVFHFGAISDTTCWDGELIMKRNYTYTIDLIKKCISANVPLSYSSSASVYGVGHLPLNLYAYSKWLVDQQVERLNIPLIQGFRYFNVYSEDDAEWHKGDQASPFYKFKQQALETGQIEVFDGSNNFYRDFVPVSRVCAIQWEMSQRATSGIFDLGTGVQQSFRQIADRIAEQHSARVVEIPFPEKLKGCYQNNTLADMSYF